MGLPTCLQHHRQLHDHVSMPNRKQMCYDALALYDMCPYKVNRASTSSQALRLFFNNIANIVKMADKNHLLTICYA